MMLASTRRRILASRCARSRYKRAISSAIAACEASSFNTALRAGVKPNDTVIGYCHIGQQATAMLFAARSLGYKVVLYDGSFEDWSKRDLPVDNPKK